MNSNENSNFNLKSHQQTWLSYSHVNDGSNKTFTKTIDPNNQSPNLNDIFKYNSEKVNCPDSCGEKTS